MLTETLFTIGLLAGVPKIVTCSTYSKFVFNKEDKKELLIKNKKNEEQYTKIENEVKTFLELQDDWDGYGAKTIPDIVIKQALFFISSLREEKLPLPIVFPRTTEEVAFFWEDEKNYVEISIGENNLSYFFETNGQVFGEENLVTTEIPLKAKDMILNIGSRENSGSETNFIKKITSQTSSSFYTSVA